MCGLCGPGVCHEANDGSWLCWSRQPSLLQGEHLHAPWGCQGNVQPAQEQGGRALCMSESGHKASRQAENPRWAFSILQIGAALASILVVASRRLPRHDLCRHLRHFSLWQNVATCCVRHNFAVAHKQSTAWTQSQLLCHVNPMIQMSQVVKICWSQCV